jgi:hypothetical protein
MTQVEQVGQRALAGHRVDLARHRQLGDAELTHPRRALSPELDQPILRPHASARVRVAAWVGGVRVRPRGDDQLVVHLGSPATSQRLLGELEQPGRCEPGEIRPGVELRV